MSRIQTEYDTTRHDEVFDRTTFLDDINIIGVGGAGSETGRLLVKYGFGLPGSGELHVWDRDIVEKHNLPNQNYGLEDVGSPKVEAFARAAKRMSGAIVHTHFEWVKKEPLPLSGVVILCVDTMKVRKRIWKKIIRVNRNVILLIETRNDAIRILNHVIDPHNPMHIRRYEDTFYSDDEANNIVGGCGGKIAIPNTVVQTACFAVTELLRFHAIRMGARDFLNNRIEANVVENTVHTEQWDDLTLE